MPFVSVMVRVKIAAWLWLGGLHGHDWNNNHLGCLASEPVYPSFLGSPCPCVCCLPSFCPWSCLCSAIIQRSITNLLHSYATANYSRTLLLDTFPTCPLSHIQLLFRALSQSPSKVPCTVTHLLCSPACAALIWNHTAEPSSNHIRPSCAMNLFNLHLTLPLSHQHFVVIKVMLVVGWETGRDQTFC